MPAAPMPPEQEAPPEGGGDMAGAVEKLDSDLGQFIEMALGAPEVPDEVKQKFSAALEAWRSAIGDLVGGAEQGPSGPAAVSPEQGGSSTAVPMRQ